MTTRPCPECGVPVLADDRRRLFCCYEHQQASQGRKKTARNRIDYSKRPDRKCKRPGCSVMIPGTVTGIRKFHSDECAKLHRKVPKDCHFCGGPIPAERQRRGVLYCSGDCADAKAQQRYQEQRAEWERERPQREAAAAAKAAALADEVTASASEVYREFIHNVCSCGFKIARTGSFECSECCTKERPEYDRHIAQRLWLRAKWNQHQYHASVEAPAQAVQAATYVQLRELAHEQGVPMATLVDIGDALRLRMYALGPRSILILRCDVDVLVAELDRVTAQQPLRRPSTIIVSDDKRRAYRAERYRRMRRLAMLGALVENELNHMEDNHHGDNNDHD